MQMLISSPRKLIFMKMQQEEITVVILLVLALLAVGAIYVASGPTSLLPSAKASIDGSVSIEGTLLHKGTTGTGNHLLLTVKAPEGPVTVFVPATSECYDTAAAAEPGCVLSVTGKEQVYKNNTEIVASALMIK